MLSPAVNAPEWLSSPKGASSDSERIRAAVAGALGTPPPMRVVQCGHSHEAGRRPAGRASLQAHSMSMESKPRHVFGAATDSRPLTFNVRLSSGNDPSERFTTPLIVEESWISCPGLSSFALEESFNLPRSFRQMRAFTFSEVGASLIEGKRRAPAELQKRRVVASPGPRS